MRFARRRCGVVLGLAVGGWVGVADAAEIDFVNASLKAIRHLYVAPTGAKEWGRDLLAGDTARVIGPGDHRIVTGLAPATYDLRLIDEDGSECEVEAIEVETKIKVELGDTQLADLRSSN